MSAYYPGDTLLHRLDGRVKILLLLLLFVLLFVCDGWAAYGLMGAFTLALLAVAKLPPRLLLGALKPVLWLVLFTVGLHAWAGTLALGLQLSLRLVFLLLLSALLTFTTSPLTLTDSLEALLSPFKGVGVPAHELALMISIALRFVPTLQDEMARIIKAQESRGADLSSGNLVKRFKGFVPILVPLFVSAFRRADDLAVAMEARCYRGGEGRTRLHELRVARRDWLAVAATSILLVCVVML